MGVFSNIFTWWNGATFGTWVGTKINGARVGDDALGNVYFQAKKAEPDGHYRRWVMYGGSNDASGVPPEWHGWLHNSSDAPPDDSLPPPKAWEIDATANLTGSVLAYRPQGALEAGGRRAAATGDYDAWSPEA